VERIAERFDCLTEAQLAALAGTKVSTVESWRKRGKGPPYILFGTRYLYPRAGVAEHLQSLIRERSNSSRGVL
jgi:hypothetical protein